MYENYTAYFHLQNPSTIGLVLACVAIGGGGEGDRKRTRETGRAYACQLGTKCGMAKNNISSPFCMMQKMPEISRCSIIIFPHRRV